MRYLVLKADAELEKNMDYTSPTAWRSKSRAVSQLGIVIEEGQEKDEGELRADPKNVVVADAQIMLSLIKPRATAKADLATLQTAGTVKMPAGLIAVGAHTTRYTGQNVTVAVLDTGLDTTHPVFGGRTIVTKDFTKEGSSEGDVTDNDGHGTHCAGTICGREVDGVRVGVAPGVTKLCAGKVLGSSGGTLEMMLNGMFWAVMTERADVVSMSLGYDIPGNASRLVNEHGVDPAVATDMALRQHRDLSVSVKTLRSFLESQSKNVVFVAASGNEAERPAYVLGAGLPAAELFAVGAVGQKADGKWEIASFSNNRVQVVAPGVDVISAAPGGGYAVMSGTSMATPHAAGVAALWVEKTGAVPVPGTILAELTTNTSKESLATTSVSDIGAGMVQAP